MTYKTTYKSYKDIGLTTIDVEHQVTTFEVPFEGPSWHSGETLESKGPKILCARCNTRKPTSSV